MECILPHAVCEQNYTSWHYQQVLKDKFVFINAELNSKLKATQLGVHEFYIARETFMPQGYGIACSSGSPLRDISKA